MGRMVGTVSRGLRAPIIRRGDDLAEMVPRIVLQAASSPGEGFDPRDRDVVAITEAIVARAQGNYASADQIAADVAAKLGGGTVAVVFPILSRNRFSVCLQGIARASKKVVLMLSLPCDEVGNPIARPEDMERQETQLRRSALDLEGYRKAFGTVRHPFTGVDYVDYYRTLIEGEGAQAQLLFSNCPEAVLPYAKDVINCDIHTRSRTRQRLLSAGAQRVYSLDQLLTAPVQGSGYNETYGLLGTNKAGPEEVKLFPRDCQALVEEIQRRLQAATGRCIEVMVYGDGAFKDPLGGIWELADPVVAPACTAGLLGTPNELKLKYLADSDFAHLDGAELEAAVRRRIAEKGDASLLGEMTAQGTTPRRLTDLIGSLCDLTSGSGDKGTPIVYIQGYFDNYSND